MVKGFRAALYLSVAFVFVAAAPARGLDSPHTNQPGYDRACGNCHWTHASGSPPWASTVNSPDPADDTINNRRCYACHDGSNAGIPAASIHSSSTTSTRFWSTLGWRTECVTCHDPHQQRQTRMWGTASYVASGPAPVSVGTWNTSAGNWTTVSVSAPLASDYTGYYFMPDRNYPFFYEVVEDTTGKATFKVKGSVNAAYVRTGGYAFVYGKNVRDFISYLNPGGATVGGTVKLFRPSGANGPADAANTTTSVCRVCHTQGAHWSTIGDAEHNNLTTCSSCHQHLAGFKAVCIDCHGGPPVVDAPLPTTGLVWTTPTGSATAGAHATHVNSKGIACSACHYNSVASGPTHNSGKVTMGFYNLGGSTQGGSYDGQSSATYDFTATSPATSVSNAGSKACSNVYCHGASMAPNGGTSTTPVWNSGATAPCGSCHGATAANPPLRGSHEYHTGTMVKLTLSCDKCHAGYESRHINGKSEVAFSQTDPRMSGSLYLHSYGGTPDMLDAYKPCILYCHSDVQKDTGYIGNGVISYTPKTWGVAGTWCGSCHASNMQNGSHGRHPGISCSRCHNNAGSRTPLHADYNIDVYFDDLNPSASYTQEGPGNNPPGNGYGTCSNMYCHGSGSPSWGVTSLTCASCHGGNNALAGSHARHYGTSTIATSSSRTPGNSSGASAYVFSCGVCHYVAPHADGPMGADQSAFVNLDATHAGGGWYEPGTIQESDRGFNWTNGRCSNTYCHSDGTSVATGSVPSNTAPAWGTAGPLPCASCHGFPPAYASGSPKANSHDRHEVFTMASSVQTDYRCNFCHSQTTADGGSISQAANHVNRTFNVRAGSWATFTYTYSSSGGTCTANYCHSNVQPDGGVGAPDQYAARTWGDSFAGCGSCHAKSSDHNMWRWTTFLMSSGGHTVHRTRLDTYNCTVCHDLNPAENDPCQKCHSADGQRMHVNGQVDVIFSPISSRGGNYSGTPRPGDGYGSCSNTYCHGDSTSPNWGTSGTLPCNSCHSAGSALAGAHNRHDESTAVATNNWATNNSTTTEYRFNCGICHAPAGTRHVNGPWMGGGQTAEVALEYGVMQGSTPLSTGGAYNRGLPAAAGLNNPDRTFGWTDGTCSSTYCHNNGAYITNPGMFPLENTSQKWDGTSPDPQADTYVCNNCHMWNIRHDAHQRHVYELGRTCDECHAGVVAACNNTSRWCSIADKSRHANGRFDVSGGFWYTFRAYNGGAGGSCAANTCHAAQLPPVTRNDWTYNHFWSTITVTGRVPSGSTCTVTVRFDNNTPYADSNPFTYSVSWGDYDPDTALTSWGTWTQINHTYQEFNTYTITWRVKDARERRMAPPNPGWLTVNACN